MAYLLVSPVDDFVCCDLLSLEGKEAGTALQLLLICPVFYLGHEVINDYEARTNFDAASCNEFNLIFSIPVLQSGARNLKSCQLWEGVM